MGKKSAGKESGICRNKNKNRKQEGYDVGIIL